MIPSNRARRSLRSLLAAVALGAAAAASVAAPAHADYVDVDLGVSMPVHSVALGAAAKTLGVDVRQDGGDTAENVTVTVDTGALDRDALSIVFSRQQHDCAADGTVMTCHLGAIQGYVTEEVGFTVGTRSGAEPGPAGTITATVATDTHDNYHGNDTGTFEVEITDAGVDLIALAGPNGTVAPNGSAPLDLAIANTGSAAAPGLTFTIDTGDADVGIEERYQECAYRAESVTCALPGTRLDPGMVLPLIDKDGDSLFSVAAGEHVLGPSRVTGTFTVDSTDSRARSSARSGRSLASALAAPATGGRQAKAAGEKVPEDNSVQFTYQVSDNPADVRVAVPALHGKVGDVVTVRATITNAGPANALGFDVYADRPAGTTLVGTPKLALGDHSEPYMCRPQDGLHGHDVHCYHDGEFPAAGTRYATTGVLTFRLRITSAEVGTGTVTVKDGTTDPKPGNNTATVRVALPGPSASPQPGGNGGGSGSLPVTGGRLGLIGGIGGALLLVGAAAVVLARRRVRS